jgi:hypothetical protein
MGCGGFSTRLGALGAMVHLVVTAVLAQGPETKIPWATEEPWTALWHLVASNRRAMALHGLSSNRMLSNSRMRRGHGWVAN